MLAGIETAIAFVVILGCVLRPLVSFSKEATT